MEQKKHSLNFPTRKWLPLSSKRNTVHALQEMEVTGWDWLKAYGGGPDQNQDIANDMMTESEGLDELGIGDIQAGKRSRNTLAKNNQTLDDILNMELDTSIQEESQR